MIVIICGGRDYHLATIDRTWLDMMRTICDITLVITGGASGADSDADVWARKAGIDRVIFPANWTGRPKYEAGPLRNNAMLEFLQWKCYSTHQEGAVLAFPGGSGTAHMMKSAREAKITVYQFDQFESCLRKKIALRKET